MYFKNDRMASYMEGDLEVEKGGWNGRIGSGHVEAAGDRCKRRCCEATGQRPGGSDLNCLMESEQWRECLLTSL